MVSQSASFSNTECHFCHGKGHIVAHCPCHTSVMKIGCDKTLLENILENFNLLEQAISEKEYGEGCEELRGCVNVMQCIVTTFADSKAWKH